MFYILYGKDTFSRRQKLDLIKTKLGDTQMLETNTSILDGQQLTLDHLRNTCNAVPFLSPFRMIIVEGLLERFETKSAESSPSSSRNKRDTALKDWQGLADYIKQMPATTVLILIDGEIKDKRNGLLKALAPLAEVSAFPDLRGRSLHDWISRWVESKGGTIAPKAVTMLAELVGGDLWAMGNELDKLLAYSANHHISDNDVRQVISSSREANIFALVDAIIEGKMMVGQQLLHYLLQGGASPAYIISMIARQLRLIVIARDMGQKLFTPEIRSKLERTSDFGLEKAIQQARAYTPERIKKAYHLLLDADIATKTGRQDGDLALNLLIIEMCRA